MNTLSKDKLEHILCYAKQQREFNTPCLVPPEDMVAIVEMALRKEREAAVPVGEVIEQPAGLVMDGMVYSEKPTVRTVKGLSAMKRLPIGTKFYTSLPAQPVAVPDERAAFNAWNNDIDCPLAGRDAKTAAWLGWSRRAAMLNSPVIPDGYALVPIEPTDEMLKAFDYSNAWEEVDFWEGSFDLVSGWRAMLAAAPGKEG